MATISFYVDPAPASTGATGTLIGGGSGLGFYHSYLRAELHRDTPVFLRCVFRLPLLHPLF